MIPDAPGAPSQLNDSLLPIWPFGDRGAPLWHMDGPIERLLRLCDRYSRVCLGWVGAGKHLDRPDFHARMEEVARALGNRWPVLHMMRGIAVAQMYPFASADGTTLAQNGWRYDTSFDFGDRWAGRRAYADRLEGIDRVGAILSAAHRSKDGHMHGHTWEIVAWWEGSPDAVEKQAELTSYLSVFDHSILADGLAWGEKLGESIIYGLGCVRVDVNRPLERIYATVSTKEPNHV